MLRILAILITIVCLVKSECPYPFTKEHNGYKTNQCYYHAGRAPSYQEAAESCNNMRHTLIMPKTEADLEDLYQLYKAYSYFYYWVNSR